MLGAGGPGAERQLWAGSVEGQVAKMRELLASLPEPPQWLSAEDIDRYEQDMTALAAPSLGGAGEPQEREAVMAEETARVYVANLGKYNEEGYMPVDADWPDTDLYDRDEIAELAREARGEARPVPLGSARPAPSPYTPQADMRGVQAPAREATPRRERAELAR